MADLDPQVQIQLIDLAWKIVNATTPEPTQSREVMIKERAAKFDIAYKAVFKTLKETT